MVHPQRQPMTVITLPKHKDQLSSFVNSIGIRMYIVLPLFFEAWAVRIRPSLLSRVGRLRMGD